MCIRPYFINYYNSKTDRCWFAVYILLSSMKIKMVSNSHHLLLLFCECFGNNIVIREGYKSKNTSHSIFPLLK